MPARTMEAVRIAIDTNLLIAAITNPRGTSAHIVKTWLNGDIEVVASDATIREAELVLGAGWLARMRSKEVVEELLESLRTRTVRAEEPQPISDLDLKDEGDLRMVEAAVAAGADYVVTTDQEFLSQRGYGRVEFITPNEFQTKLRLI